MNSISLLGDPFESTKGPHDALALSLRNKWQNTILKFARIARRTDDSDAFLQEAFL